ncbi:class I SAM-dependent methyltransferase [Mesorhizobium sp.]|jgi:hypothetical protein|uniref:class I SAM-dependent methyltransferase n=1 Tax=Mesorhizobium sp. TaxID=1871066 RepID=UPI00356A343C
MGQPDGLAGNESGSTKLRRTAVSGGVAMKPGQFGQLREAFVDFRYRLRRDGAGSLLRLGRKVVEFWNRPQSVSEFDREFDTDTEKNVPLWRLNIDSANRTQGIRYQSLAPILIRNAIEALPADLNNFSFCDLGSGKGRVLMVASEYPFKEVIGVEFSHELHIIANNNLRKYRSRKQARSTVSTLHLDAANYRFPSGNLVIFLFNPFGESVLRSVLANLERALIQEPRAVWIIYFNAVFASVIEESFLFTRVEAAIPAAVFRHEATAI